MNSEYLVEMANRIGEFFAAYPDQAQGEAEIADHIKRFWEPRMRRALLAHVDATRGQGMAALVLAAVLHHRAMLTPEARMVSAIPILAAVAKRQS